MFGIVKFSRGSLPYNGGRNRSALPMSALPFLTALALVAGRLRRNTPFVPI